MARDLHYPTILFDWGDTVMKDDPASNVPMLEWQTVETIPGVESVLAYLQTSGRRIVLATSASISNESTDLGCVGTGKPRQIFLPHLLL